MEVVEDREQGLCTLQSLCSCTLTVSRPTERSPTPERPISARQRQSEADPETDRAIDGNPQIKISVPDHESHEQSAVNNNDSQAKSRPVRTPTLQSERSYDWPSGFGQGAEFEDSTSGSATPADGYIIPEIVTYTLHVQFEGQEVFNHYKDVRIHPNNPSNYGDISKAAAACVEAQYRPTTLAGKSLNFRNNGTCTITCEESQIGRHTQGLSTESDWKDICTVIFNFWRSSQHHKIHLDIYREYYGLLTRRISDERFAETKRQEIWRLMKTAFDGRKYIPRSELTRIASMDMIREIITDDPTVDPTRKETLIQDAYKNGPILLTMCVHAQLRMECLKVLLDNRLNDKSYPLGQNNCCHEKCGANFDILLQYQGAFNAAVFFTPGEHQKLPKATVVPIHFHPRNSDTTTTLVDPHETSSDEEMTSDEEDANSEKRRAHCGSGAYSNVYRVRIDPAHHRLTKVSKGHISFRCMTSRTLSKFPISAV